MSDYNAFEPGVADDGAPAASAGGIPTGRFYLYIALTAFFTAMTMFAFLWGVGALSMSDKIELGNGEHSAEKAIMLQQVWNAISDDYYVPVNEDAMLGSAAAAIAASVNDPYTVYYTPEEMKRVMESTQGVFVGIGAYVGVMDDGTIFVSDLFEGSPAALAGVAVGDVLTSVDGAPVAKGDDLSGVVAKVKGEAGTTVVLGVYRPSTGESLEIPIERGEVKERNVVSTMLDGSIGYLRIVSFDSSAYQYFEEHLDGLLEQGALGLVIDLRDNPGGNYEEVVKIADRLLGEGVIVYTQDRAGNKDTRNSDARSLALPLKILVNGNSASASEILAGAVKDHGAGRLVGQRTFGKGLVQAMVTLKDGSGLRYTRSSYYTPSGTNIQGEGIEPDIVVEPADPGASLFDAATGLPRAGADAQLQAALDDFLDVAR